MLAPFGLQWQVVVTDILLLPQFPEGAPAGGDIPEGADFPESLAEQLGVRIPQQLLQEWVGVGDPSRVRIQDEYAVFRRLEESPVADFGSCQRDLDPLAFGDLALRQLHSVAGGRVGQLLFQAGKPSTQGGVLRDEVGFRSGWHLHPSSEAQVGPIANRR